MNSDCATFSSAETSVEKRELLVKAARSLRRSMDRRVTFSKTGRTLYYGGQTFKRLKGSGFKAN